jgi:hypothetical protein
VEFRVGHGGRVAGTGHVPWTEKTGTGHVPRTEKTRVGKIDGESVNSVRRTDDDDVFYLFLQKQKIDL